MWRLEASEGERTQFVTFAGVSAYPLFPSSRNAKQVREIETIRLPMAVLTQPRSSLGAWTLEEMIGQSWVSCNPCMMIIKNRVIDCKEGFGNIVGRCGDERVLDWKLGEQGSEPLAVGAQPVQGINS